MHKSESINKITKCLSLSESSNTHEAALALERAQSLMDKYQITMTDVEMAEISSSRQYAGKSKKAPLHTAILVNLVESAFGCKAIYHTSKLMGEWRAKVEFVGFGPNPEIAAYVFSVLHRQMERERKIYIMSLSKRMKQANKTRMAEAWARGWAAAVNEKVRTFVLSDREMGLVNEWVNKEYGTLSTQKRKSHSIHNKRSNKAFRDGIEDGDRVQLNRAMRGQQQAAIE